MGSSIVPNGSICAIGFKVSLPACLAVGSPNLFATHPCAASWKVIATTTGIAIMAIFWMIELKSVSNLYLSLYIPDLYKNLIRVYAVTLGYINLLHYTGYGCVYLILHFHRLNNQYGIACLNLFSNLNFYPDYRPRHRCRYITNLFSLRPYGVACCPRINYT